MKHAQNPQKKKSIQFSAEQKFYFAEFRNAMNSEPLGAPCGNSA
jgi:hypothetical protein